MKLKEKRMFDQFWKYRLGFVLVFLTLLSSCSSGPKPIEFDVDNCDFCQMTISDQRYGAELVTKKGRIYKFDDLHCLKGFLNKEVVKAEDVASKWVIDFSQPSLLIAVAESNLIQNEQLKSPMGSNIAAFSHADSAKAFQTNYSGGVEIKWENYLETGE